MLDSDLFTVVVFAWFYLSVIACLVTVGIRKLTKNKQENPPRWVLIPVISLAFSGLGMAAWVFNKAGS